MLCKLLERGDAILGAPPLVTAGLVGNDMGGPPYP